MYVYTVCVCVCFCESLCTVCVYILYIPYTGLCMSKRSLCVFVNHVLRVKEKSLSKFVHG